MQSDPTVNTKISKMDTESDNSLGLNSSFNITSLDP